MEEEDDQNKEEEQPEQEQVFEDDDEEDIYARNPLTQELLEEGMNKVVKVFDGSSYAMVNLQLRSKEIDELGEITRLLVNVRYLDVSDNLLKDIAEVAFLPNLIKLEAQNNQITSMAFLGDETAFKFLSVTLQNAILQEVNLSKNRIQRIEKMCLPGGAKVNLNENLLENLDNYQSNPLEVLELRKNKIVCLKGLRDSCIKHLYLAENLLVSFSCDDWAHGYRVHLQTLHLRQNKIENVKNFPEFPALAYLNLRDNQIQEFGELKELVGKVDAIKSINFIGNPCVEAKGDSFKSELVILLEANSKGLAKISKEEVTEEEMEEARKEKIERQRQAEEDARLAAEAEAEKLKQEAEGEGQEEEGGND